jgi:hypothetical protein
MTVYPTYNGCYAHVGPNSGIRATWDSLGKQPDSACWISQGFPNQLWAQVGFFNGNWFYQVWSLSPYNQLAARSGKAANLGKPHAFEISAQGNRWRFLVDGKSIGNYGIGSDVGAGDFLMTNEFTTGTENVLFTDAMVEINGVWQPAASGSAYISGTPAIGLAGHLQDAALAPGSLRIGGAASVTNGTQLW